MTLAGPEFGTPTYSSFHRQCSARTPKREIRTHLPDNGGKKVDFLKIEYTSLCLKKEKNVNKSL